MHFLLKIMIYLELFQLGEIYKGVFNSMCKKVFGAIYFLQKGTPFIYQGQELGMTNVKYHSICEYTMMLKL